MPSLGHHVSLLLPNIGGWALRRRARIGLSRPRSRAGRLFTYPSPYFWTSPDRPSRCRSDSAFNWEGSDRDRWVLGTTRRPETITPCESCEREVGKLPASGGRVMRLLTVKDVAIRLQVKDKTVYVWANQGKIPALKLNGVIRFEEQALERWLQACQVPTERPSRSVRSRHTGSAINVDHLIENAKRAVYTPRRETRPIASPFGEEERNGTR